MSKLPSDDPDLVLRDLLVDPQTRDPVTRASASQLEAIGRAISAGKAKRADGGALDATGRTIAGAYVSHGGRWIYADAAGFPSFLIEDRIELDEPV